MPGGGPAGGSASTRGEHLSIRASVITTSSKNLSTPGTRKLLDTISTRAHTPLMAFVDQLDIAPRTKGRAVAAVVFGTARELTAADLALLASERGIKPASLLQIRERHHALARCLAGGMSNSEASVITGYDPSRISILKSDPLFQALVADYATMSAGVTADFVERANVLGLTVMTRLQEAVEADEPLSPSIMLEIGKFAADRSGNGATAKTQNVNVNINLGERLRAARERSNAAMKQIGPAPPEVIDITPRKVG